MRPESEPSSDSRLPDVPPLAGRYHLLDKLGQGGMGTVYRARDAKLDREVAIKLLPADSIQDADAVARFRREARALARLAHPGIIHAHDSGEEGDKHFLVLELVRGSNLADVLRDQGRVPPTRAADYAHQAALALQHAHEHGLVHRDVKPSNLLVTPEGRVKVLDLGLARFIQDQVGAAHLTLEGAGLGTPDYASPEQFRSAHQADPRSDIYSVGCTLYHLIGGRVPFPGSSLSEKVAAHETKEPVPLEELCPDMPAGLALVVQRMLAKRPAERFQTMADAAAALAPYVSTSSPSFRNIRATSTWTGAQLATLPSLSLRRRARPWLIGGLAAATLVTAIGLTGLAAGWFRPHETETLPLNELDVVQVVPDRPVEKPPPKAQTPPLSDPNILTVTQDAKGGGKYRTIGAALEAVEPGQTIRILDSEVYRETLLIQRASKQQGITLEAPRGATIEATGSRSCAIKIAGVMGVTIRQLRLRGVNVQNCSLVGALGDYFGLRLEDLDLAVEGGGASNNGIELHGSARGAPEQAPLLVQGCQFRGLTNAVILVGAGANPLIAHVAVRNSHFLDCEWGVHLIGKAEKVQVAGNRFWGMGTTALQFELLNPESADLSLVNNTIYEGNSAFRLWDGSATGKNVQIRNNLVLGCKGLDLYHANAVETNQERGPGDGAAVARAYRFSNNWRDGKAPTKDTTAWIPPDPTKGDVLREQIDGINRNPKSPDFLRPDPKAALNTAGAGNEDPSLPRYVGALPSAGVEAWDWDRAWRMPSNTQLLTVSKEEQAGGKYRSLNAALKDARPWATIRVLDSATYQETIVLDDRKKHEGLTLEAIQGATLRLAEGQRRLIMIADVPHVRLAGFRLTDSDPKGGTSRMFVTITGNVPGVQLTRLDAAPAMPMYGILVTDAVAPAGEAPLRIEFCTIRPGCSWSNDGISVFGTLQNAQAGGLCIRGNRIFSCARGINLRGALRDVQVTGNLVAKCVSCGIQVEDVAPASRRLLVANNTAVDNASGFRFWDNKPYEDPVAGQVEIVNNLFFRATDVDMGYILNAGVNQQAPGDGTALLQLWHFHHNRRDLAGVLAELLIPLSERDIRIRPRELLAVDPNDLDRIRPGNDSPLATQGAGTDDASLPRYIGALPPEGTPLWDWERSWHARRGASPDSK